MSANINPCNECEYAVACMDKDNLCMNCKQFKINDGYCVNIAFNEKMCKHGYHIQCNDKTDPVEEMLNGD